MKKITMSAIVEDGKEEEICQNIRRFVGEKNGKIEDLKTMDAPSQDLPQTQPPKNAPPKGSGATLAGVA